MIDTTTTGSPGWHAQRLAVKLRRRTKSLRRVRSYYDGTPPLPPGADEMSELFRRFIKLARLNFAELIVEAVSDRVELLGFRTAAEQDEDGDARATDILAANGFDVAAGDLNPLVFTAGVGYVMLGDRDDSDVPAITVEDPYEVITEHDPLVPHRVTAALKLYYDDLANVTIARVFLPGEDGTRARMWVATHPGRVRSYTLAGQGWNWDGEYGGADGVELPVARVPVVRYANKGLRGEYATHTDHLDRLNLWIYQGMLIAINQAHRQRAIKGDLPKKDPKTGKEIDYNQVFSNDPGSFWLLPAAVDVWESGTADLQGLTAFIDKDVQRLAAVTRTPLFYLTADATNGSAEGASLSRESLTFKARDRIRRIQLGHRLTMSVAFEWMGDEQRADFGRLEPIMAPAERYSLAEKADAAVKAKSADVPWATRAIDIWQQSPGSVRRQRGERNADLVDLQMQAAAATIAASAPTASESATTSPA